MEHTTHNTQYILRKLQLTELQYAEYVEEGGYEWLHRYFDRAPDMIEICSQSKMFWLWWINQWEIRDKDFVNQTRFRYDWPVDFQRKLYATFHNIQELIIIPNRMVIQDVNKRIKDIQQEQQNNTLKKSA